MTKHENFSNQTETKKDYNLVALNHALELGNTVEAQLNESGSSQIEFLAWDEMPAITNTARIVLEHALNLSGDTFLAKATEDPSLIRKNRSGGINNTAMAESTLNPLGVYRDYSAVAGTFWEPVGEITGPKSYGIFSSEKIVPLGEAFGWSNGSVMAVLVYTYGINAGSISAVSRGILITEKMEQGGQEQLKDMLKKSKEAAIKVRSKDARQRRAVEGS